MNAPCQPLKVLVYSDDVTVRQQVIGALGGWRGAVDPTVEWIEVATEPVVLQAARQGDLALAVLDGQAVPAGGLVMAKRLKTELDECPPVIVLTSRPEDACLAACAGADASVAHPIDDAALAREAEQLLRSLVEA